MNQDRPSAELRARPIGVFDSGIGGLTVVRQLLTALPEESILYFGDTARVPYGTKSPETVTRFTREAAQFLIRRNVKALIVACNSASAVAFGSTKARLATTTNIGGTIAARPSPL